MAVKEGSVKLKEPADAALRTCARALTAAGFKNIQVNADVMMVTGEKRTRGQWSKGQATITLEPADGVTTATVMAQAKAQSLPSLASSPAQRMVDQVIRALVAAR